MTSHDRGEAFVDNLSNLLVCIESEYTGNGQNIRNELFAYFGIWIGYADDTLSGINAGTQDLLLRTEARRVLIEQLRARSVQVIYRDAHQRVITGAVDFRHQDAVEVAVVWDGVSRKMTITPLSRNDARTTLKTLVKFRCSRGLMATNTPTVSMRPANDQIQKIIQMHLLQGLMLSAVCKASAAPISAYPVNPNILPVIYSEYSRLPQPVAHIGEPSALYTPTAQPPLASPQKRIRRKHGALVQGSSVEYTSTAARQCENPGDFVVPAVARAVPRLIHTKSTQTQCIPAELVPTEVCAVPNSAESQVESISILLPPDIGHILTLPSPAITISEFKNGAFVQVSPLLSALELRNASGAASELAENAATENAEKTLEAPIISPTSETTEQDTSTVSVLPRLRSDQGTRDMSLETANAINTLMLFSSDIRCSTGLNVEEFAITPANLTMPDSSQTAGSILVTVCDNEVSMPISASRPLSATVSSRLKSLREVIQEGAKTSILTIEIDADPASNNLLGWSKLHVHEPKKFNQSIRKMVLTDQRDIWNRFHLLHDSTLKRPTWGVYELLRNIGVHPAPRSRGNKLEDPGPDDRVYHTEWVFKNDQSYEKSRKRLFPGFFGVRECKKSKKETAPMHHLTNDSI